MQKQEESPLALQIEPTYLLGGGLKQWEGGEEKVDRRTFWLGLRTVQLRQREGSVFRKQCLFALVETPSQGKLF